MPTARQSAASRANSQKSTGPRTTAGKAVSRFNALKHGIFAVQQIMFDEAPGDLAELTAEYHEHHRPADSNECLLVDALVDNEWRLRRMRRIEARLWQTASDTFLIKNFDTAVTCTSADAFVTSSSTFERLQRVVNFCERAYHRALKQLGALGRVLRSPQPKQSKATSALSASFRQNSQTPLPPGQFTGPDAPADHAQPHPSPSCRDPKPPPVGQASRPVSSSQWRVIPGPAPS